MAVLQPFQSTLHPQRRISGSPQPARLACQKLRRVLEAAVVAAAASLAAVLVAQGHVAGVCQGVWVAHIRPHFTLQGQSRLGCRQVMSTMSVSCAHREQEACPDVGTV
jgi:hypothetical protein